MVDEGAYERHTDSTLFGRPMRALIISILLLSTTTFAMRGFQFPAETGVRREPVEGELTARVNQMYNDMVAGVGDGEAQPEEQLELQALDFQENELANGNLQVQWGRLGNRFFVNYRAADDQPYTELFPELGEILNGGVIAGTPYFYFVIQTAEGRRFFLFSFESQFVQIEGLPDEEFKVFWVRTFNGDPNQLELSISYNGKVKTLHIVDGRVDSPRIEVNVEESAEEEDSKASSASKAKKKGCGCLGRRRK